MKKRILTILMLGIITASLIPIQASFAMEFPYTRTLWAGQNINVGTLTVDVIDNDLIVTFETTGLWTLTETHLYVGFDPPAKSAPGKFPYKNDHPGGVMSFTYTIENIGTGWRAIAAHAVVKNSCDSEETAWGGDGCPIGRGKNWAMYFWIEIPEPA